MLCWLRGFNHLKEDGMENNAYFNSSDRIECNGTEFTSGDVVIVYLDGTWKETRIEHNGREYYSVKGYQLIGNPVKIKPFDAYSSRTGEVIPYNIKHVVNVLNLYIKDRSCAAPSKDRAIGIVEGLRLTQQINNTQADFIKNKIERLETFDVSDFY